MNEKATWLPQMETVEVLLQRTKADLGPLVKIRRIDGQVLTVPRKEVLLSEDTELISQLKLILQGNNPARNPAYFSTVRNLLQRGAPLHLVCNKTAPKGEQLKMF